jgi:hypothetical protein
MIRKAITYLLIGCAVFVGWKSFARGAQETVLLHTATVRNQDHFATLWVVDDGPRVWIRAENRERRWLGPVQVDPKVELRRRGRTQRYLAVPFDDPDAIAYVDALFRAKYGFADRVRALFDTRDPLPIRLEPR